MICVCVKKRGKNIVMCPGFWMSRQGSRGETIRLGKKPLAIQKL